MPKQKPPCETVLPWLKANLGKDCLAPLTPQDRAALAAAVQLVELYAYVRQNLLVAEAFGTAVSLMQPSVRYLAYHAIAHVLDWGDREKLWNFALLDFADARGRCLNEP